MKRLQRVSWLIAVSLLAASQFALAADPAHPEQPTVAPAEAVSSSRKVMDATLSGNLAASRSDDGAARGTGKDQHPFAVILSCSDSRVPPEIVFDQGLGDLFVVRVAGNVIDDHGLGSIEYAVDHLGARLIVVLGHQSCGAVKAAKETIAAKGKAPGHINRSSPPLSPWSKPQRRTISTTTVKANVKHVVQALRSSTPILKAKVDSGEVQVIGGYYSLDTGAVSLLDEK